MWKGTWPVSIQKQNNALKGSFILTEEMYGASLRKEATVHFLGSTWFPRRHQLGRHQLRWVGGEFRRWQSATPGALFCEARGLKGIGPDLCTSPCFPSVSDEAS